MTYGELRRIRAEGETLPMEWPLPEQFRGREAELDGLGVSEVKRTAEEVYRLTMGAKSAPAAPRPALPGRDQPTAGAGDPRYADEKDYQP